MIGQEFKIREQYSQNIAKRRGPKTGKIMANSRKKIGLLGNISLLNQTRQSAQRLSAKISDIEKRISEELDDYRVKEFLGQKLYDNLSDEKKRAIDEFEEHSRNGIFCSSPFDPRHSTYVIENWSRNPDDTSKIKIQVEAINERQYLGITGAWIPSLYETDWFDIDELNKVEETFLRH